MKVGVGTERRAMVTEIGLSGDRIFRRSGPAHMLCPRGRLERSRSHGYENRHGRMAASDRCGLLLLRPARGTAGHTTAHVSSYLLSFAMMNDCDM